MLALLHTTQAQDKAKRKVAKSFDKMLKKKDIHNGFVQIKSADGALNWKFTGGTFQDGTPVGEANPFHSASLGKTFTATIIMRLAEEGKLQLNDKMAAYLDSETVKGLHVFEGVDYSQEITIAQLLQHTSGLPDYLMDKPKDGSTDMLTLVLENHNKYWEVGEMIAFSKGKMEAHFKPGEGYYYTDTEYLLLGRIIERNYQKQLHEVFADEFFIPIQMNHTSMFKRSKPAKETGAMAEFYVDETEISNFNSLTIDWAGGGLVTTTEDLITFEQALFNGEIISQSSLQQMQNWIQESKGTYYGFGLRRYDLKGFLRFLPELNLIGHTGSSAAFSFYCPELEVYIAGSFNQTNQVEEAVKFVFQALMVLKYDYFKPFNNEP